MKIRAVGSISKSAHDTWVFKTSDGVEFYEVLKATEVNSNRLMEVTLTPLGYNWFEIESYKYLDSNEAA